LKTALIHEWLTTRGGSEKAFEAIYEVFPSPVYTLVANRKSLVGTSLEHAEIITSFIQKLPMANKRYRSYLALFPYAIEQFDLTDFDVLVSSNHCVAKGVLSRSDQLHICYCYSPVRYAWDLYHRYVKESGLVKGLKAYAAKRVLHKLRIWDVVSSARVNYFVAISEYIARRIRHIYNRDSAVIYPPVEIDKFSVETAKDNYYLTASRMVPYKMMPLIVGAVVIGDGPEMNKVKNRATKNIEVLGYQPFTVLREHLMKARAFVFAADEDFGILPVEAQACGTPVIAFGKGGATETVIPGKSGIFFNRQDEESIIDAVTSFEQKQDSFDPYMIRKSSERFSVDRFKNEFKKFVEKKTETFFS
jgi:glycosyltransferase involved in cell wall biosynthesis